MSVEKVHQNYPFFYKNIDFSIKKHIKVVIFFDNGIKHQWIKTKERWSGCFVGAGIKYQWIKI